MHDGNLAVSSSPLDAAPTHEHVREQRFYQAGRVLALVGAALLAYVVWMPWAFIFGPVLFFKDGTATNELLMLDPGSYAGFLDVSGLPPAAQFFLWSVITVVGLLCCPLLWQSARSRLARAALRAYILWFVLMVIAIALITFRVATMPRFPDVFPARTMVGRPFIYSPLLQLPVGSTDLISSMPVDPIIAFFTAHMALVGVAIGVALLAIVLLIGGRPPKRAASQGARAGGSRFVAATVTMGLLVWAGGYFLAPWASAQTGTISGPPVLFFALSERVAQSPLPDFLLGHGLPVPVPSKLDPLVALDALSALLLGGALLLVVAVWVGRVTRAWVVWAVVWFALAAGIVLFSAIGVLPFELDYPEYFTFVWAGPLVSALGLGVVAMGVLSAIMYRGGSAALVGAAMGT